MKQISISDTTMKVDENGSEVTLSFREKIELAKLLDKVGISVIETHGIVNPRSDGLLIKSLASTIKNSVLAVPVSILDSENMQQVWNALKGAVSPRLQVQVPVSTVQMEYFYHAKAEKMKGMVQKAVSTCKALCPEVEFTALDAGRADREFLKEIIGIAIEAGATVVTYCDTAGTLLPDEFLESIREVRSVVPEGIKLGVHCSDELYMSNSCAMAAVRAGADEVKTVAYGNHAPSLGEFAQILAVKGIVYEVSTSVHTTELKRTIGQIKRMCDTHRPSTSPFDNGVREGEEFMLGMHDDISAIRKASAMLGYDLSEEDVANVYGEFLSITSKKEQISSAELDALIATVAMQVPPVYQLESYVINSGNIITGTSHIKLRKNDEFLVGLAVGDGPIDASFLAIEQIIGRHLELDDFQIRAVTEGREAMGEAVVRLRSNGRIYSGRGISTDIVGASIYAYINAVNKIVYEEETL